MEIGRVAHASLKCPGEARSVERRMGQRVIDGTLGDAMLHTMPVSWHTPCCYRRGRWGRVDRVSFRGRSSVMYGRIAAIHT